jgi:cobalt-zinc-cadmium efflux system membrane fusion protein
MSTPLATVADTSRMWAMLDLPEWDAASVHLGDKVEVKVDGAAGKTFTGKIGWIAAEVNARTRTVEARVTLDNVDGLLRSGQFARATVRLSAAADGAALTIPRAALQQLKKSSVVFVRTGAGAYEAREVKASRSDGQQVQVTGALKAGEAVVTTGAFLLRTEMDRESIGAGCCESTKGSK